MTETPTLIEGFTRDQIETFLAKRCRESLFDYVCTVADDYEPSLFHGYLCNILTQSVLGDLGKRIIISAPPRHGKSRLVAEELGAWFIGMFPRKHVVLTSYSHARSADSSRGIRDRMFNAIHRQVFPDSWVRNPNAAPAKWFNNRNGSVRATSFGGNLTGFGADLLIIDDVHKDRTEADSQGAREKVWNWYRSVTVNRLSTDGVVIIISTRWHPDDLIGRLMNPKHIADLEAAGAQAATYKYFPFPALCDQDEGDLLGRARGEALWPERWNVKIMQERYAELGPFEARALLDQQPVMRTGNEVDVSKIVLVNASEIPADLETPRGWDIAVTANTGSDSSAGAKGGYDAKTGLFWLTHIHVMKERWHNVMGAIGRYGDMDGGRIRVEAVGQAQGLFDDVKKERAGKNLVSCSTPVTNKMVRAAPWLALIDAGKFRMVRGNWNNAFLAELMEFPGGLHDDQIDAVSIVWELTKKKGGVFFD